MTAPDLNREPPELVGKNYRVRMIAIEIFVDLYDNAGLLTDRHTTNKIIIPEAQFPPELVALLFHATNLKNGFATLNAPDTDLSK